MELNRALKVIVGVSFVLFSLQLAFFGLNFFGLQQIYRILPSEFETAFALDFRFFFWLQQSKWPYFVTWFIFLVSAITLVWKKEVSPLLSILFVCSLCVVLSAFDVILFQAISHVVNDVTKYSLLNKPG